jgi:surface antigen
MVRSGSSFRQPVRLRGSARTTSHYGSFGVRLIKEGAALGFAIGLGLALAEPAGRLIAGSPNWGPADIRPTQAATYNLMTIPHGIDRGLCDRPQVASDLRADGKSTMLISDAIGARMDMVDQRCVGSALEFSPDQQRVLWRNGDSGVSYAVTATRTYENDRGVYCREFDTSAVQTGQLRQTHGIACRQQDGIWTAVR